MHDSFMRIRILGRSRHFDAYSNTCVRFSSDTRTMELETGECKEGNAIFKPKVRQRAVAVFDGYLTYASKLRPPLKSS